MNRNTLIGLTLLVAAPLGASADAAYSFATDPQSVAPGAVSGAITVSASSPAAQTTCLLVSSDSSTGQFSSSATSWNAVAAISMSKGTSNRSFYYQDPTAGTYTLTVRIAPKPDSVSSSCTSWSGASAAVAATITQSIAVGSGQPAAAPQSSQNDSSQTQAQATSSADTATAQSGGGGLTPPPVSARITTDAAAVVGAGTVFVGSAFGTQGEPLGGARFVWNFGDGTMGEGARVVHTFAYPGTYDVQLSVGYNFSSATARLAVPAVAADVALVAEGDGSLSVYNRTDSNLDVGLWSLRQGTTTFVVPEGTVLLAQKGIRFAPAALKFAGDESAKLYYPNGALVMGAAVGANSPLRGQVVSAPASSKQAEGSTKSIVKGGLRSDGDATSADLSAGKSAYPKTTTLSTNQAAAAAAAPFGVEWSYLVGLAAVVAIGAVGSYYAYIPRRPAETPDPADEFDIE